MNLQTAAIRPAPETSIYIAGEEILLDPGGCAIVPRLRLLVVSDLHLEKGSSQARRRIFLPPYDSHQTLDRLEKTILYHAPERVVCLGDSFHDEDGHRRLPDALRLRIARLTAEREWCWISGNHDPSPPEGLGGFEAEELAVGPLVFRHQPQPGAVMGEIAGHLHPGATVRRHGRAVRRPCFVSDGSRMILPAFGAYTGMLSIFSEAFQQLFAGNAFDAYLLGKSAIYPLAAGRMGGARRSGRLR